MNGTRRPPGRVSQAPTVRPGSPSSLPRRLSITVPQNPALSLGDLDHLDVVHSLLAELNDPKAAADMVAKHVQKFPAFAARITSAYLRRQPARQAPGMAEQIARLGNREIEAMLLTLLEELTELRANSR